MAQWRKFKAQFSEALRGGVQPHPEDLRDAILEHLPDTLRLTIVKEEATRLRNKFLVWSRFPPPSIEQWSSKRWERGWGSV